MTEIERRERRRLGLVTSIVVVPSLVAYVVYLAATLAPSYGNDAAMLCLMILMLAS